MKSLLWDITKFARHSKEGKEKFAEFVQEWSRINLDNYSVNIEKSRFVLDLGSIATFILAILNFAFAAVIIEYLYLDEQILSILLCVLTFGAQIRLIFLFLSFMLPSSNIILAKNGKEVKAKEQIIVCAHYDIKNCIISKPKGRIRGFIKYNIYSFSRMLTQYVLFGNKASLIVSALLCIWWFRPKNVVQTFAFFGSSRDIAIYVITMVVFLVIYDLLAALLMVLFTLPYPKKLVNQGSDDNASGVVGALEIAKRLNSLNLNADIKIILFDNEEKGLIGSSHFVARNLKELRKNRTFVINLDCIGRGSNVFALGNSLKNNKVYKSIKDLLKSQGTNVISSNIDFSDHKSFLSRGVAAISIGRYNLSRYLWVKNFPTIDWIHGVEDNFDQVDVSKIEQIVDVVSRGIKDEYSA